MLKALGGEGPAQEATNSSELDRIREALQRPQAIITGIGSRETPPSDMQLLTNIGAAAEKRGMRGRSGGAGGADLAFEKGFSDPRNIDVILPWKGFLPKNMTEEDVTRFLGRQRPASGSGAPVMLSWAKSREAEDLASKYHPAWHKCSPGARALHTRNMPQVLGLDLAQKSDLVVCWTVDGKDTGGTGQAMRIAKDIGVPIANLKNPAERQAVLQTLGIADPALQAQHAQAYENQRRFGR